MRRKNKGWEWWWVILDCVVQEETPPKIEQISSTSKSRTAEFLQLVRLPFIDKCSAESRDRQNNTSMTTQPYHSVRQHHAGEHTEGGSSSSKMKSTDNCRPPQWSLQSLMRRRTQRERETAASEAFPISQFEIKPNTTDLFLGLLDTGWNIESRAVLRASADRKLRSSSVWRSCENKTETQKRGQVNGRDLKEAGGELRGLTNYGWKGKVWKTSRTRKIRKMRKSRWAHVATDTQGNPDGRRDSKTNTWEKNKTKNQ